MTAQEYSDLTGVTLTTAEADRFDTVSAAAEKNLERLLGYPLDPSDWANLYNETGKTQDDCVCPDVDADLDPADAVVGKYRIFDWVPTDRFVRIDPATTINKVKLIREDITYHTFDVDHEEVAVKWEGTTDVATTNKVARWLDMRGCDWPCYWTSPCWKNHDYLQIAVDATWGYSTVPTELTQVLADLITYGYRDYGRDDIQSESRGTHSYTLRERTGGYWVDKYPALAEYAGPNGAAYRPRHA